MTMPATAQPLGNRLPSAFEQAAANQLRTILAARTTEQDQVLTIVEAGRQSNIALTPALSDILMELLRHLGRGDAVTIVPVSQMLTTQQAADILNVSRPHLVSLLEKQTIPFTLTGRHRRIKADDLFAYKKDRDTTRAKALSDLAELDSGLL